MPAASTAAQSAVSFTSAEVNAVKPLSHLNPSLTTTCIWRMSYIEPDILDIGHQKADDSGIFAHSRRKPFEWTYLPATPLE
jgi:hypothetical protein